MGGGKALTVTPTTPTATLTPPGYGPRVGPHSPQPLKDLIPPWIVSPQGPQPPQRPTAGSGTVSRLPPPPSCAIGNTAHLWARRDTVTCPITHPRAISAPPPPAALLDSRVSFLWALGGGLQTPGSFSPALSTGLAVGAGTESPPAPGGSLGGGGGAGEGLPGGSAGLEAGGAGGALGGVLGAALSPSGLGKLGIFSRFTTGMNKLGRNGAVRGGRAAPGGGGGWGTATPSSAHQRLLSFCAFSGSGCALLRAPLSRSALPAGCPLTAWHLEYSLLSGPCRRSVQGTALHQPPPGLTAPPHPPLQATPTPSQLTAVLLEGLRLHHLAAVVANHQVELVVRRAVAEDGHVCGAEVGQAPGQPQNRRFSPQNEELTFLDQRHGVQFLAPLAALLQLQPCWEQNPTISTPSCAGLSSVHPALAARLAQLCLQPLHPPAATHRRGSRGNEKHNDKG